ncbi:MAG TPA: DUF4252 domain-containing protein [Thermoanaerobaculia bacterium]|jgi:hypothetical protein
MKKHILTAILAIFIAMPAAAQRLNLDFPGLAERAEEVVDVTLDGSMLRLASKFLSDRGEEGAVRTMVQKLEGIYVKSFTFDKDGEYDRAIVDRVRAQIGAGWNKIVNVRGKRENVEIFVQTRGELVTGLVVISAEPRELTVVNIVGPIDLDRLADLEGQFGIPRMTKKEGRDDRRDDRH